MLVEALETEFVPVLIQNNRAGRDAELLAKYDEPAWNNPVVRFFSSDERELVERRDRVWRSGELAERMVRALEAAGKKVPPYLSLAVDELSTESFERAVFAMA